MEYSPSLWLIAPLVSAIVPFLVMVQTRLSFPSSNSVSALAKIFGSRRK